MFFLAFLGDKSLLLLLLLVEIVLRLGGSLKFLELVHTTNLYHEGMLGPPLWNRDLIRVKC